MIKAQPVFDGNGIANGSIELGQIVDFIGFTQAANSDTVKINHKII